MMPSPPINPLNFSAVGMTILAVVESVESHLYKNSAFINDAPDEMR